MYIKCFGCHSFVACRAAVLRQECTQLLVFVIPDLLFIISCLCLILNVIVIFERENVVFTNINDLILVVLEFVYK